MKTMLDSLPIDGQRKLLSETAALVLPNPGVGAAADDLPRSQAQEMLEYLRKFYSDKEQTADKVESSITSFLTERLKQTHLEGVDRSVVRTRLREKGLLPITHYKLVFNPAFSELNSLLQIRRSHIEEALQQPTAIQRFEPSRLGFTSGKSLPLLIVTKRVPFARHGESTLMVQGIITGEELVVGQSLRIFHEDIKRPTDSSPLALLRSFVDTYGAEFVIGDRKPEKFIFYDTVPWQGEPWQSIYPRVFVTKADPYAVSNFVTRPTPLGAIEITVMYSIFLASYVRDLIARGLPIDRSDSTMARASASIPPMLLEPR